jgi:cytochrome c oxidase accessory protein FixG
MIISYDTARGEPRGSRPKSLGHAALKDAGKGECIDCTLCVQVCPTGIDIRKGLQYECIGCAACIDVCDGVMDKMGYPRGLIRYATQNGIAQQWTREQMLRRVLRPRVLVYGALLSAAGTAFAVGLAMRSPVGMDVIRDRGVMARLGEDGRVQNLYRVQLMNRTERTMRYELGVEGLPGLVVDGSRVFEVPPGEVRPFTLRLALPAEAAQSLTPGAQPVTLTLTEQGQTSAALREHSTFLVPR